jgi:hypothetical protein
MVVRRCEQRDGERRGRQRLLQHALKTDHDERLDNESRVVVAFEQSRLLRVSLRVDGLQPLQSLDHAAAIRLGAEVTQPVVRLVAGFSAKAKTAKNHESGLIVNAFSSAYSTFGVHSCDALISQP